MIKGQNINSVIAIIKKKLCAISQDIYLKKLSEFSKLNLYSSIKTKCIREPYLVQIHNVYHRKSVSQLRLSSHKLPIEAGRHEGLKRVDRICKLCKISIGTEEHCLMECLHPALYTIRNKYFDTIFHVNKQLCVLPRKMLFKYIMLFSDVNHTRDSAKYVFQILETILQ